MKPLIYQQQAAIDSAGIRNPSNENRDGCGQIVAKSLPDPFIELCRAYLRSYRERVGGFARADIKRMANECALGARSEISNRRNPPVPALRSALVKNFAKLEAMLRS